MSIKAPDFGRVAVLMGGWAAERQVSLKSGAAVLGALQRRGVDAVGVDVGADIVKVLQHQHFDRAFIIVHGRGGEDGVLQALMELFAIPYTGTGVQGSAIGMDKYRCKLLWSGAGLPTPGFVVLGGEQDLAGANELGYPLVIKPAHEGSSIGVSRVDDEAALRVAWEVAAGYDSEVLAERWITGGEYTVAILGDEVLPVIKLEVPGGFYDYAAKYERNDTRYLIPCGLDAAAESQMQRLALQAFRAVGCKGWGRVDFMADAEGRPWLLEVNTVPGMTDHSLVPMAARARGIEFDELVWRILSQTLEQQ